MTNQMHNINPAVYASGNPETTGLSRRAIHQIKSKVKSWLTKTSLLS